MATTHAIIAPAYGGIEVLEFAEVEVPGPGEGQVTIEVRASGVNPSDLKQMRGEFGRKEESLPLRPGAEVSGVITAVGEDAVGPAGPISVGDEVIGYRVSGGFSQRITVSAKSVVPKPASLPWDQAAGLLLTGVTAWHLLEATGVGAGDRVIVHGASGSVGALAVQLAVLRGATVVGTSSTHNLERVAALGATAVEYGPGLADRIRATWPDGADVALDTVGTDEAVDVSIELVADVNRIATINAFRYGGEKGIKLLGGGPGADPGSAIRAAARVEIARLAGEDKLAVEVAHTFPLEKAAEALELIDSGHPGGKIVLLP